MENAGNISHQLAEEHARAEFDKYDAEKRRLEAESPQSDFDMMVEEAKKLEKSSPPPRKPGKSARQKKDGGK